MLRTRLAVALVALVLAGVAVAPAGGASRAQLDRDVDAAMARMYETVPNAKWLGSQAKGVLVFPSIVKAGFLFGAQYGEGALRRGRKTAGYYNTVAASYGLQAGAQTFGYALFFLTDAAIRHLDATGGFEVGLGPSIVILDQGMARSLTTATLQGDIYAVFFDQRGLMGGGGLQGSKITRLDR